LAGARWSLDGAEAVLRLCALIGNGDFDDYFAFHIKQEKRRNPENRYQRPELGQYDRAPPRIVLLQKSRTHADFDRTVLDYY
jgi:hypothetical protein